MDEGGRTPGRFARREAVGGDEGGEGQAGFGAGFELGPGLRRWLRFEGGDVQVLGTGGEVAFHEDVTGLMGSVGELIHWRWVFRRGRLLRGDLLLRVVVRALRMKYDLPS